MTLGTGFYGLLAIAFGTFAVAGKAWFAAVFLMLGQAASALRASHSLRWP